MSWRTFFRGTEMGHVGHVWKLRQRRAWLLLGYLMVGVPRLVMKDDSDAVACAWGTFGLITLLAVWHRFRPAELDRHIP